MRQRSTVEVFEDHLTLAQLHGDHAFLEWSAHSEIASIEDGADSAARCLSPSFRLVT